MRNSRRIRLATVLALAAAATAAVADVRTGLSPTSRTLLSLVDGVGRATEAPEVYAFAIARTEALTGPGHALVGALRERHAQALERAGRSREAFAEALRAEDVLREQARLALLTSSEADARRLMRHRASALDLVLSLAVHDSSAAATAEAWDRALQARTLVFDELAERQWLRARTRDPELRRLALALDSARSELSALRYATPPEDGSLRQRDSLARREVERLDRALAARGEQLRYTRAMRPLGFAEVARSLPDGEALLAYTRYVDVRTRPTHRSRSYRFLDATAHPDSLQYAAFVLAGPGAEPRLVPLGNASEIEPLVSRWRDAVAATARTARGGAAVEARARASGDSLRRRIWDPVAPAFAGARRVRVVADGALWGVPLGALPHARPMPGYLIEDSLVIGYLDSERDAAGAEPDAVTARGLLVVGGVDFGTAARADTAVTRAADCRAASRRVFAPLPATREEALSLLQLWQRDARLRGGDEPALLLLGADASERAFCAAAPGRRVLHVATHGFRGGRSCSPGADPRALALAPLLPGEDDPLLACGLAFAGANQPRAAAAGADDGVLSAAEVLALDLRGTSWVALSACESGLGQLEPGEGMVGMRRAFARAGAHVVVSSLWPVEDASTSQLMLRLYHEHLTRGCPADEALQRAARDLLQRRRRAGLSDAPGTWGGFVALGRDAAPSRASASRATEPSDGSGVPGRRALATASR